MPSLMQLKSRLQDRLRPVLRLLHARGITPNALTCLTLVASVVVGVVVAVQAGRTSFLLLLPPWLLMRLALNTLDGMLAREYDLKTPLGAVLNEVSDVVCDAALMLPFSRVAGMPSSLVVLFVVAALISEVAGLAALAAPGGARRYDGPLSKPDRTAAFALLALLLGCGLPAGAWTTALIAALVLLSLLTTVNRVRRAAT